MKQIKTKLFFFIPFLALIFTAQGCLVLGGGGGQGTPVELVWWKPFDDPRYIQPLIEAFQSTHQNIRITYVKKNIETYEDELVDALASGRGPDIFSIHNDWLPKHKEKIAPFPEKIFSLREFQDNFLEVANFDLIDKGQIYAVPLGMDVLALYYNKDILASAGIVRPPATWKELMDLTPKITRQDSLGNFQRSAVALGTADNINRSPDILGLLMLQTGTQFYDSNRTTATFGQTVRDENGEPFSPGTRALEFYTQFANPAKVTYNWNNRSNNSIEAFSSGQVAMIFSYSYLRATLAERAPFLNYGIAGAPQIDSSGSRVNYANYWAESISKQSKNQAAAWEFLKFISSKEILPKYYEVQKQVSPRLDILETQLTDPEIGMFAENALSARSFYKPSSDAVESIFVQMINDVVLRNISPAEAIGAAVQKVNLLLRKS
jgi:ABC-type glycerol-3-phosphate transport system substrate-binding protein